MAPPWYTAAMRARRSMARVTAWRSLALSNGGFLVLRMRWSRTLEFTGRDHELGHRLLELIGDSLGRFARERHIHASRLKRRRRRAALRDDQVSQPVQVGPSFHEVLGVLHVLDELALAPLLQLEGPCADTTRPVARRRHVSGVDRRESRSQHEEQGRLRPLQAEHDGEGIEGLDRLPRWRTIPSAGSGAASREPPAPRGACRRWT